MASGLLSIVDIFMKVYALMEGYEYEGSNVAAIYANEEDVKTAMYLLDEWFESKPRYDDYKMTETDNFKAYMKWYENPPVNFCGCADSVSICEHEVL